MAPALSIIIPHYNHAVELSHLLESICRQTMTDLEVIVVDDCSEQPCDHVISAYYAQGLNVRLLRPEQKLYTKNARLLGVSQAKAEIVAFADCDDVFCNPPSLAEHAARFHETGADVLHFNTVSMDDTGAYLSVRPGLPFAEYLEGSDIFSHFVSCDRGSPVWGKLYARQLCLHIASAAWDYPIKRYSEDTCHTSLLLFHAKRYVGSDITGYRHRYKDKREVDSAERAVAKYVMLTQLVPYLAENGCAKPLLEHFAHSLKQKLCMHAGRFCQSAHADESFLSDAKLDALLELADARTWMKILAMGNGMNASKIVQILRCGLRGE